MFNIRAVVLDYYISKPIDELYEKDENFVKQWQEPVIRIFGSTPDGVKSCAHIHGVYPYIYVPYRGGENPDRDALLLGFALDEALKSGKQNNFRFVHKVSLISGIPLYGYHSKHRQFFKIFFYNPFHIRRASELLLSGAILGQKLQPHEAHIPYVLQFMMDYNVYGMSFVSFSKVKYRRDPERPESLTGIKREDVLSSKVPKITWSYYEVDVLAKDVASRSGKKTASANPGLQAIWEDERNRRRAQNRASQITPQLTQSRPTVTSSASELMYKERLAKRLQGVSAEEVSMISDEPEHSYPAEVPEESNILEASVVDDGSQHPPSEEVRPDAGDLVDEKILTQILEEGEEEGGNGEEERAEADSVLGRNPKEEEEELEDGDGEDMTQPLDLAESFLALPDANRDESGKDSSDSEEFWRSMADKIIQLDGAQDSSSESDPEGSRKKSTGGSVPHLSRPHSDVEMSPGWSNNIMSILSEDSSCPTPSSVCQTPRTFWSNYSPKMDSWLPQTQDSWVSGEGICDFSVPAPSAMNSNELYVNLFGGDDGEYLPGSCTPSSALSPISNVGSISTVSPPSAILTPASEPDAYSDVNPDSIYETLGQELTSPCPSDEGKPSETKTVTKREKGDHEEEKLMNVLKSFANSGKKNLPDDHQGKTVSLTLKQYIKDCSEIVNVDFKNLCNREMVVIEYKPLNRKSGQSKFLIKPLDKFLQHWNIAERKLNNKLTKKSGGWPKVINGFAPTEKNSDWLDSSKIKSIRNKLSVKSVDNCDRIVVRDSKSYKVNENVISRGKIKMKLIKSQMRESEKNELWKAEKNGARKPRRGVRKSKSPEGRSEGTQINLTQATGERRREKKKQHDGKIFSPLDTKLINQINSSFEEYFKNIVKLKSYGRNENTPSQNNSGDEETEKESSEDEEPDQGENAVNPVDFVTRFLSTFSRMPELPPLSITISLGSSSSPSAAPIQLNLQPATPSPRKHKRKMKIQNVDGAADSSSDESLDRELKPRAAAQKRLKREGFYKPLNVVVGNSPAERRESLRKRKISKRTSGDFGQSSSFREDCLVVCRESPKSSPDRGKKNRVTRKSFKRTSGKSLVKGEDSGKLKKTPLEIRGGAPVSGGQDIEPDFIYDSEEEKKSQDPMFGCTFTISRKAPREDVTGSSREEKVGGGKSQEEKFERDPTPSKSQEVIQELSKEVEVSEDEELDNEGIISFYDKTTMNFSEMEGLNEPKSDSPGPPSSQVSPAGSPKVSSTDLFPGSTGSGTGCSRSQECLTLSGSPLFASRRNSSQGSSNSSQFCRKKKGSSQEVVEFKPNTQTSGAETVSTPPRKNSSDLDSFLSYSEFIGDSSCRLDEVTQVHGSKTIVPKRKPPSRKEVYEFLIEEGIGDTLGKAPFYSNPRDVTKAMESGPRILKIESESVAWLKPHRTSLDVLGTEDRRGLVNFHKKERWAFAREKTVTIVPLRKPPCSSAVAKWRDSLKKAKKGREDGKTKKRLVKALSPGQESEEEEEIDLSMTMNFSAEGDGSSKASVSPLNVRDPENQSTPIPPKPESQEVVLKKGPLSKIKGIKRFSLLKKLEAIAEETKLQEEIKSGSSGDSCPNTEDQKRSSDNSFQIRGITCHNTWGFDNSVEDLQNIKLTHTHQYMSMLVMELHIQTRGDLRPDPQFDPIRAVFYAITFDSPARDRETGIIVVGNKLLSGCGISGLEVCYVDAEVGLIEKLKELIRAWDPDILAGYEIEMHSWGYLIQRAFVLETNLLGELGRVKSESFGPRDCSDLVSDAEEFDDAPRSVRHMRMAGRIVLDIWRVLRHEVALTSYTFENVMYHLSHERHPLLSYKTLSFYWEHPSRRFRHITVDHYASRVVGVIRLLDQLDFINRTSELSRLFGIQFYEVLSRGSQYRVESMMLRLAKPLNYVPASPSVAQRAAMRAPASLPLILEPESLFYPDPLIVLDFQSLYPSMIIAYNYCFSTCLGRVEKLGEREPFEFGCTRLQISPEELKRLENDITISPAGIAFVKSNIRKGVLPAMLEEILETRLMVKKSMKENKDNKVLQKVLYARQLGLKLIANVTYGYTAANFSGRMPCIEVGDSVVSKGRETLQRAIQLVKNTRKWGAKVVYGDTDSIFVLTPGRSLEEAFKIGAEIAEAVTQDNPKPVKLKLEKVYLPSILQTKKRYVGHMYESPEQAEPIFEAKGIETVRRDGCPATGKILRKALQILFDTRDVSLVKKYSIRQFTKLFQGRVNIQDLIFAKEYRGRKGYRPGACVPALQLAKQWTQVDKRAEPRKKERVPYLIVNGPPGVPLIRLVRSPTDLILDRSLRINAVYYITKAIIPPMARCFSLLGADVMSWYSEVPRKYHKMYKRSLAEAQKKSTISQYFSTVECVICSGFANKPVCPECERKPQTVVACLGDKVRRLERCHAGVLKICQSCCGRPTELDCCSLDCPVLFRRHQALRDSSEAPALLDILESYR